MLSTLAYRLKPLLIGLVILVLTTGVTFAGKPSTPADGPAVASEASGKTVPVVNEGSQAPEGDEEKDESAEDGDAKAKVDEAGDNCATDPRTLTPEQLAELTHCQIVCWAAHQATPEGYDNHGAWVSEWAKQNHGQGVKATKSSANRGQSNKP